MGEMVLTPYKYSAWNYLNTCEVALFLIDCPSLLSCNVKVHFSFYFADHSRYKCSETTAETSRD